MLALNRPSTQRWLTRYRGLLLSLAFVAYLAAVQPLVLRRLARVIDRSAVDSALVVVFLAAAGLEMAGLWLKAPGMQARLRAGESSPSPLVTWLAWMGHALMGMATLLLAAQALGIDAAEPESDLAGALLMGLGLLVVIKELLLLFHVFLPLTRRPEAAVAQDSLSVEEAIAWRETWGDLLIFPFSALAFSLLWDFTIYRTPFHAGNLAEALLDLAGASLIYAIAQFAARGIYLAEDLGAPRSRVAQAGLLAVQIAGLLVALLGWTAW